MKIKIADEAWCVIKGFPNYKVSSRGRIYSQPRPSTKGGLLSPCISDRGYKRIMICRHVKGKLSRERFLVHRLVAQAFLRNPKHKPEVNHKDGKTSNNHLSNLEWCTRLENEQHAWRTGQKNNKCFMGVNGKYTEDDIIEIRRLYAAGVKQSAIKQKFKTGNISMIVRHLAYQNFGGPRKDA